MAASLAGYASSEANDRPSVWLTGLLSAVTPGLGHIYIGQTRRGIAFFVAGMLADTLVMLEMMSVLARFWMFAVSLAFLVGLWLYIIADAVRQARRLQHDPRHRPNRWAVCAGALALAWLVFAVPCIYALHAKASGQLLWLTAVTPSMEPTLETGEYFLADSTYYRTRKPSRGEVVVYVHPREPGLHRIKRIIAIEGDRIAVKAGRAKIGRAHV